ncbi:MAG: CoA transferase, partial [Sphingomonadales bacterium]|nr:CoA transferase [Sphingomonadales bacterium]
MADSDDAKRKLQVANARPEDSGRGVAHLPRAFMAAAGIADGDVVEIVGKKHTPARAVGPYADDEGLEIVRELAAKADVVVENFRAGTADRLGVGWEALRAVNPRLIYCSISGYGQTGPDATRPGYDFVMQAESGLMAITGEATGEP